MPNASLDPQSDPQSSTQSPMRALSRPSLALLPLLTLLTFSLTSAGCLSDDIGAQRAAQTQNRPDLPIGMPDEINANFLDEEMDVSSYVERFEGESRAVYAERASRSRNPSVSRLVIASPISALVQVFSPRYSTRPSGLKVRPTQSKFRPSSWRISANSRAKKICALSKSSKGR